jgi:hypothetical protein
MSLTISALQSKVMLFTRKHERLLILVRIGSYVLPQTTCFKYLGMGLRWSCHVKYVRRRCLQRVNLLKLMVGVCWGAHPSCLILLYRGLIEMVLKYGLVCFTDMAKTHMLGLERVQNRSLRITLGLMGSTPNNCLSFLSGGKIRILEIQISCCCLLSIGPPFKEEAGSAEHGSLHQKTFRCFIIEYSSIRVLHAA